MWLAVACATIAATYVAALALVESVRRRPFPLAALLAFAVLVAFEAAACNALSMFRALTRPGVLVAHGLAVGALVAARRRAVLQDGARWGRRALRSAAVLGLPGLLLVPVVVLVLASALRYAPNNWDSMTYHLARVAYWIQQGSVDPYPTHVNRQLVLMPGAEYVLAMLQVVSGTDRLASFVQFAGWILVVLSAPALARLAGAPRRLAPWAAALAASVPMGVLQASSTQNDLVAAALAVGAWVACTPLLHGRPGAWRPRDVVLLAAVLSAATVVRAPALIAAMPLLAVAALRTLRRAVPDGARKVAAALGASLLVAAIVVGPELARRSDAESSAALRSYAASYLYPVVGDLGDRALNLARGIVRHVPLPREVVQASGVDADAWCGDDEALCGRVLSRAHEDYAGNPAHVLIAVVAAVVAALRWRRLPRRARLYLGAAAAAWVLFHVTFRDNAWISRLELPTFVLSGIAAAAVGGFARQRLGWWRAATAVLALGALAHGTRVAARNETRPPFTSVPALREATYYANQPPTRQVHDVVLRAARQVRCDRLGIVIGGDSYDYPLAWRAMQAGVEVRHVFGADPWPCLIFAESVPAPLEALRWQPTIVPFLFLNAASTSPR